MGLEEPRSRYEQVADLLRDAIKSGMYPPGSMLPSQTQMSKTYDLHQTMIGRAIAALQAEGLVRVVKGKGAFVQDVPTVKRVRRIDRDYRNKTGGSSFAEEMRKSGVEPSTDLVQADVVDPPADIAERFALDANEQVLVRRRHMSGDGKLVQIAISYIPLRYAGSKNLAFPDTGPSGIYARLAERGYGPVRFSEDIEVRRVDAEEARLLQVPKTQMVFNITRTAIDSEDRPVEACVNIFSVDQYRLTYSWRQEP